MKELTASVEREKAPAPVKNWKRPELRLSLVMRIALERASRAQPPIRSMAANVADPWRTE